MSVGSLRRLAVASVLLLAAAGWAPAMSRRPPAPPSQGDEDAGPTSSFEGVEVVGEDADGTVWQLQAERGWGRETAHSGRLVGVRARLRKAGRELVLTAGEADIEGGDAFVLGGGVEITWGEYATRVDRASYRKGEGRITAPGAVQFEGPGLTLSGRGLEVDIASQTVRIAAAARAQIAGALP